MGAQFRARCRCRTSEDHEHTRAWKGSSTCGNAGEGRLESCYYGEREVAVAGTAPTHRGAALGQRRAPPPATHPRRARHRLPAQPHHPSGRASAGRTRKSPRHTCSPVTGSCCHRRGDRGTFDRGSALRDRPAPAVRRTHRSRGVADPGERPAPHRGPAAPARRASLVVDGASAPLARVWDQAVDRIT